MSDHPIQLALRGLSAGYTGREVLRDIQLEVRRGEILTLIGPNGAGKSTLLHTICGQLAPLRGEIEVRTRDGSKADAGSAAAVAAESGHGQMRRQASAAESGHEQTKQQVSAAETAAGFHKLSNMTAAEIARQIAVVFTQQIRPEHMTCREVVEAGRYPYTGLMGRLRAEDEAEVTRAMERMHVEELAGRPFDAISDGQRQRVMVARAMAQATPILVLDEPTSYLDIRYKDELMEALRALSREGVTVIMSLHEVDLALAVSDRLLCIREGETPFCGTPQEVLDAQVLQKLFELSDEVYERYFGRFGGRAAPKDASRMFTNRDCPYFPCHKTAGREEDFNCLFCYCPLYAMGEKCGGNFRITDKGVKDCTLCMFPHRPENYEALIQKIRAWNRQQNIGTEMARRETLLHQKTKQNGQDGEQETKTDVTA